jgi:hypothetical protein
MKYLRLILITLFVSYYCDYTFPQTNTFNETILSPTANNFAYPQSIFVDSKSGHIWVTDFDNNRVLRFDVSTLTVVDESEPLQLVSNFFLRQNYPNPFNSQTEIIFSVTETDKVLIEVYNALGQKIATLFNDTAAADKIYFVSFDAGNLPSGIYMYSLRSAAGSETKKMCLLK